MTDAPKGTPEDDAAHRVAARAQDSDPVRHGLLDISAHARAQRESAEPHPGYHQRALARVEKSFTYQAPKGDQPQRYEWLRSEAKDLAIQIMDFCPESRERSLAITHLEQAVMWANKAIAVNE